MHQSARAGKRSPYNARMLGIVLSTIAFFVASFLIKRYLDEIGIPKSMVRGMVVFVLALAVAYGVAFTVDWFGAARQQ
jgi:cation transporter-like permease